MKLTEFEIDFYRAFPTLDHSNLYTGVYVASRNLGQDHHAAVRSVVIARKLNGHYGKTFSQMMETPQTV